MFHECEIQIFYFPEICFSLHEKKKVSWEKKYLSENFFPAHFQMNVCISWKCYFLCLIWKILYVFSGKPAFATWKWGLCLHVTPQVVHSFVTMELHSKQSSTKEPAIIEEGYLMCQCFLYMHSAAGFSALLQKNMIFVYRGRKANLSYLEFNCYHHYCCLCNFYKSPFKLSKILVILFKGRNTLTHPTRVKLVSGWIFGRYSLGSSCDFTEVHPVSAAWGHEDDQLTSQSLALNHWRLI